MSKAGWVWVCSGCGFVVRGEVVLGECPSCFVFDFFVKLVE